MPRKSIAAMIPDIPDIDAPAADAPEIPPDPPDPPAPEAPESPPQDEQKPPGPAPRRQRAPRARSAAARPSARDLAAPSRPVIAREALKADVPAELALLQRLRRYRLDTGTDIRDQVAIAVDEWLASQGY